MIGNVTPSPTFPCRCGCSCAAVVERRGDLCDACEKARNERRAPHEMKYEVGICNRCGLATAPGLEAACDACKKKLSRAKLFGEVDLIMARPDDGATPRPWRSTLLGTAMIWGEGSSGPVSGPIEPADARLIVRCVNAAHEVEHLPTRGDQSVDLATELATLWGRFLGDLGAGQASTPRILCGAFDYRTAEFSIQQPDGEEFVVRVCRREVAASP